MQTQIRLVAVYQPIWFHFNPVGVAHEIILGCLRFISQLWFMTFKVKNNWPTLDVFYKTCSGANTKSWKMSQNRRNAWRNGLRKSRDSSRGSMCIFTTGASLASYVSPCLGLVYTASNRSCKFLIKKHLHATSQRIMTIFRSKAIRAFDAGSWESFTWLVRRDEK